jgi:hypothetical protein
MKRGFDCILFNAKVALATHNPSLARQDKQRPDGLAEWPYGGLIDHWGTS